MLKQEAYETSITPINDSMMNHFEKRGNDTIQKIVEQVNSNSSVIVSTVQTCCFHYYF
jgi:predicted transcriptional regulator